MDSSFSQSPRRSHDTPKPDTGLAEWTNKIKAIQRQVDADEEDEQKRLEEEIAAARQARLRRSRGMGGGSRTDSLDLSQSREQLGLSDSITDMSSNDIPKSFSERENDRESALRKLMDRNKVYNPDRIGSTTATTKTPSLAAFMGGHASGPRLNKHAPQQDAHDPTQFSRPDLSAPHPVFGSGGVAMPGMAAKREAKSPGPIRGSDLSERYRPSAATVSKSMPLKDDSGLEESTKEMNRRSFSATPKSPSPALSSRYAEKFNAPIIQETKPPTDSVITQRKSFSTIPKSASPLPQPMESPPAEPVVARKKSFGSIPKVTSPVPPAVVKTPSYEAKSPSKPADLYRSPPSSTPSKSTSPYIMPSYLGTLSPTIGAPKSPTTSKPTSYVTPSYLGTGITTPSSTNRSSGGISPSSKDETPLRRLMEKNKVYNPDRGASDNSHKSVAERAQTTSLAAFMGAPGKGIRLNKHAPQIDAHDPTQFTQPDTSTPHPVFGKGGIAMPGMATRKSAPAVSQDIDDSGLAKPSATKKTTWPTVATSSLERPVSPHKTGQRERTTSAPRTNSATSFAGHRNTPSRGSNRSQSPSKSSYLTTPARERTISTPSVSSARSTTSVAGLARPKQPEPKPSTMSPQIPPTAPSPAFLKPTGQKDLTPSLSRLQGRGFVQNMVKNSSQTTSSPASSSPVPTRPSSAGGKKTSVLDRWQPGAQPASPTKCSQTPPPSTALTRTTNTNNSSSSNGGTPHALKTAASLPAMAAPAEPEMPKSPQDPYPRSRTPGLGSATTMVVIKPRKSFTDLTELGVKSETTQPGEISRSPSPRKPLIHLTKDRAKKPSKSQQGEATPELDAFAETLESNVEEIPVSQSAPASRTTFGFGAYEEWKPDRSPSPKKLYSQLQVDTEPRSATIDALAFSKPLEFNKPKTPEPLSWSPIATSAKMDTPPTPSKERFGVGLPPGSPAKHTRIPSTGNRATVMEVAQALSEIVPQGPEPELEEKVEDIETESPTIEELPPLPEPVARPRTNVSHVQAEKRRSTYERYSSVIMPPLKEEQTPTPSPAGTFKQPDEAKQEVTLQRMFDLGESEQPVQADIQPESDLLHLPPDGPPVKVDQILVQQILRSRPEHAKQDPDQQMISVDVLSIVANAAVTISKDPDIFFENEILAIVHRVKSKSSGLAITSVWCWMGRQTQLGDKEEKKLNDLAKRYGTTAKFIHQLSEPSELVKILGGRLAIRQGSRNHWTSENTTMHLVRSLNDVILVDEHDLTIKHLCSAFSYCFTILGSIYIWHGCGSTPKERQAALSYAQTLSPDPVSPIELVEGENDDDELFWMMLGDEDFARADYWRWRRASVESDPSIWRIDCRNPSKLSSPVEFLSTERDLQASVYIINCIWELFVLVGKEARGQRQAIRTAFQIAKQMSEEVAPARPFKPTVHALIVPTQLPADLRLGIRDMDEAWLNNGEIPDHLNLISSANAEDHLNKLVWERTSLVDPTLLPLGIGADKISQ